MFSLFFRCPIGDYANAVVTFVVPSKKGPVFLFVFMAFLETCCVLCNH